MSIKLPIGAVARFALKRIVAPAIARAVADGKNPLTAAAAKDAVGKAINAQVGREIVKRAGG